MWKTVAMANVTITLADDVLDDARALAKEQGLSMSAWIAAKVKRDMRDRHLAAYKAWRPGPEESAELEAFDRASEASTAASWSESAW